MMSDSENCQNALLNTFQTERTRLAVFLVNGVRLVGHIESFDQYVLLLRCSAGVQAEYKHAISTIQEDTGKAPGAGGAWTTTALSGSGGTRRVAETSRRRRTTDIERR
ncbi:RNA chaperone Hfq [Caballeronia telluris]|uniref:RNA chaperone Hfq n=1 Tax=Caballeronia telluris TaxID=326475 RepID=UPI003898FF60